MLARIVQSGLTFAHRWIGIVVSLMVVVWFASGIAMIYFGGMPGITAQTRLDHLPALDLAGVRLTPAQAAARLEFPDGAGAPVLVSIQGRPAYRFAHAGNATVFADDGAGLMPLDERAGAMVARQYLRQPAASPRFVARIDSPDQWTLTLRGVFPLLKYAADGTQLYVSTLTGEVVQATTRGERAQAWISTIPHWLYFSGLRQNQPVWYWIVVTLATLACVLAALGLVLAITHRRIPYRGGMRWHYITGAVFGVFALTWAFSGLVSMEPFGWTDAPDLRLDPQALSGGEPDLTAYDTVDFAALGALAQPRFIKALDFRRILDAHYVTLQTSAYTDAKALPPERLHAPYDVGRGREGDVLVDVATLARHDQAFDARALVDRLVASAPGVRITELAVLGDYDDYYYSRSRQQPLPVLRVKLDDPAQTWLYVDARAARLLSQVHRSSRLERWLYSGLHSLDFRFWYAKRPLWDFGMLVLLLGGLAGSGLGLYHGIRRLAS
jgi:hypothetical protein